MNVTATIDISSIMLRAQTGLEAERAKIKPLLEAYVTVVVCLIGIIAAFGIEMFTLTVALHAKFPELSDGTNLGKDLMPMRYGIGVVLIIGHTLLHYSPKPTAGPSGNWLRGLHLLPLVAIILCMAAFMFTATAEATSVSGQLGLSGAALGIICGALFSVSFLGSNILIGLVLKALPNIYSGRAQRTKVAEIAQTIKAVDDYRAQIKALQRDISVREQPNALRWKASEEAAAIVGEVAAIAHDIHVSVNARKAEEFRPQDEVDLPDAPVETLDERQKYLKTLTAQHFFDLLSKKGEQDG